MDMDGLQVCSAVSMLRARGVQEDACSQSFRRVGLRLIVSFKSVNIFLQPTGFLTYAYIDTTQSIVG